MTVLIAGGAGYIGAHTAVELITQHYQVVIADNFYNSNQERIEKISAIVGKPVEWVRADLTNYKETATLFASRNFDTVFNFAAYKAVGESVSHPISYYENNLNVILNLCKAMREYDVPNMIFSSSAAVYGNGSSPMTENQPLEETHSPYGETKRICERMLTDFYKACNTKRICILRYFNPIGAHKSGLIGETAAAKTMNLVPLICKAAKGETDILKVYGNDYPTLDGTCIRDYVHILDVAKGHVAAMKFLEHNKGIHIFNLGTGQGTSVLEVIHTFEDQNNIEIPYQIYPRRKGDVAECYASVEKAHKVLKWHAEQNLKDMVRDAWNFESGR